MTRRSPTRICFVGDSLTLGIGDPQGGGWVRRLLDRAPSRGGVTGYNLGIRRDTSRDIATRWRSEVAARLPASQPGAIVFAFGTNDCLEENGSIRVPREKTLALSRRILAAASSIAPTLMIGPPPTADPAENGRIGLLAGQLEALCAQDDVPYFNSFGNLVSDRCWTDELRRGDGYHPAAAGYELLATSIAAWAPWERLISPMRQAA